MSYLLCTAQQSSIVPYQKKAGGKWGYRDSISLKEVYPCKFVEALPFKDGIAPIFTKKKWGLLKEDGTLILPPTYSEMQYAQEERLRVAKTVKKMKLWGYISSKTGKVIIPVKYTSIGAFNSNGIAKVNMPPLSNGYKRCGYIDISGKEVIPPVYTYIGDLSGNGYTWANYLGAIHGSTVYRGYHSIVNINGEGNMPQEKFFIVFSPREARELDKRAKEDSEYAPDVYFSPATIFKKFESSYYRQISSPLTEDVDGYYFFTTGYHNKAGVVTKNGEVVIPDNRYDAVSLPIDGKALVYNLDKKGGKTFYIYDVQTKNLKQLRGTGLRGVADGVIRMGDWTVNKGKTTHTATRYFNMQGTKIGEDYKEGCDFHNKVAVVKKGTMYGVIDTQGKEVIPFGKYQHLGTYDEHNLIVAKNKQGQVGYINHNEEAIIPFDFQYGSTFRNGYAAVGKKCEDGEVRYGLIDTEGNSVVPCEYSSVSLNIYKCNKCFWMKDALDKWLMVRLGGAKVNSSVCFDSLISHLESLEISVVKNGDKYALVSLATGEIVAPLMLTDKDKLIKVYQHFVDRGITSIKAIDILRYIISEKNKTKDYKLANVIDEGDWDF